MTIFFNDLSTGDPKMSLADNFDKVWAFSELIGHLNNTIGVSIIASTENFYALQLCDTKVSACSYSEKFKVDHGKLIGQLVNYFHKDTDIDKQHVFSHINTRRTSILLGNAHKHGLPAISFTFHNYFSSDYINGLISDNQVSIVNLYDKSQPFKPSNFVTVKDCKPYDPTNSPLWNKTATKVYHDSIKDELETIATHPEMKIPFLERHSTFIAELNGWELDEGLTKLNKTTDKYRRIFRSAKFSKGIAYLSIDFEKPDIHFELCNKKGKHLGEYCWDGTLTQDKDKTGHHDIRVR